MRRWLGALLLLAACEDAHRSHDRDDDGQASMDRLAARAAAKKQMKQEAMAHAAAGLCLKAPPDCLPLTGMVDKTGHDLAADLAGKVVVLDFCSASGPCVAEIATLDAVAHDWVGKAVTVVGVEAEDPDANPLVVELDEVEPTYPILARVDSLWVHTTLPTSYLYDKHGALRDTHVGAWDQASLDRAIDGLLAEP